MKDVQLAGRASLMLRVSSRRNTSPYQMVFSVLCIGSVDKMSAVYHSSMILTVLGSIPKQCRRLRLRFTTFEQMLYEIILIQACSFTSLYHDWSYNMSRRQGPLTREPLPPQRSANRAHEVLAGTKIQWLPFWQCRTFQRFQENFTIFTKCRC